VGGEHRSAVSPDRGPRLDRLPAFAPDGRTSSPVSGWPIFYHKLFAAATARPARRKLPVDRPVDPIARLWDTESGKEVRVFEGHRAPVRP